MTPRILRSSSGFTYIAAIFMVVIMGIMLAKAAQVWKTKTTREKETELLFRGSQIRTAMTIWYTGKASLSAAPGQTTVNAPAGARNLTDLKDLLKDPASSATKRYLRPSMLIDPITGKEWGLIKDGARIIGVASTSEDEPLKQGNFPDEYLDFEGKKKYTEWQFVWNHIPPRRNSGTQTGLPTSGVIKNPQ